MHELSITESILEIALRHANQAKAQRVTRLYLVIGQLASIVDDSVQFYWEIISKGTIADGSLLQFRRIPAKFMCLKCSHEFTPDGSGYACPECASERIKIISGEEFYVEAIDVEP